MLDPDLLRRSLLAIGFLPNLSASGDIDYLGSLQIHGNSVRIRLRLVLGDVTYLPKIYLLKRPNWIPQGSAHIEELLGICIGSNDLTYLNRTKPVGSILGTLELAKQVLEDIYSDNCKGDTSDEFPAYWNGSPLLECGTNPKTAITADWKDRNHLIICDQASTVNILLSGADNIKPFPAHVLVLTTNQQPLVAEDWPIDTFHAFTKWLQSTNPSLLTELIDSIKTVDKASAFIIHIKTPTFSYAIQFKLNLKGGRRPELIKKHFSTQPNIYTNTKIQRLSPLSLDPKQAVYRNLPSGCKGLDKLKIAVIGCGAVGGHIAETLTNIGAGLDEGTLLLVDHGIMETGNISRHILGVGTLFEPKAMALRDYLSTKSPSHRIKAIPERAESVFDHIKDFDLLIDATGHEGFSQLLSEKKATENFPPIIHTWVTGNGSASFAYLQSKNTHGCFHCLLTHELDTKIYKARNELEISRGGGCNDIRVPFSIPAASAAASLAGQLAIEWASGTNKKNLRSVTLDLDKCTNLNDRTILQSNTCPYHAICP